jgi:hypothetical protein
MAGTQTGTHAAPRARRAPRCEGLGLRVRHLSGVQQGFSDVTALATPPRERGQRRDGIPTRAFKAGLVGCPSRSQGWMGAPAKPMRPSPFLVRRADNGNNGGGRVTALRVGFGSRATRSVATGIKGWFDSRAATPQNARSLSRIRNILHRLRAEAYSAGISGANHTTGRLGPLERQVVESGCEIPVTRKSRSGPGWAVAVLRNS